LQSLSHGLGFGLSGTANADAAAQADIVVVTVPFDAQERTLTEIAPRRR
jgi:8-hydroxy-5-deazaflavin:NADPH oxidoreductase